MASQDSNETTSDRVQLMVDGEIVTTHAPPDGTPISADAVLLRLRQQKNGIEHFNFVFLGTEDTVKGFVQQQREPQERLGQEVRDLTVQRDAARGPDHQEIHEVLRQRGEARGAEFTARASAI